MKRFAFILPVASLLSACDSKPTVRGENASVAEVDVATKDAVKLEPGKWETTVAILSVEGPGLPPGMADAMKQQSKSQKVQTCLTPEQAAKPPQDMLGAAKNCTYEKFEMGGGKMDGTLVCNNMPGMPSGELRATTSGKFASTSYNVISEATMEMPPMGGAQKGGKVITKTKVSGKRLGECHAPKAG